MFTSITFLPKSGLVAGLFASALLVTGCSNAADKPSADAPAAPAPADFLSTPGTPAMPDPSTVLAVVNGSEITLGEFNKEMDVMISRMQGRVPPERIGQMRMQMRDQLLDSLITRQLLIEATDNADIELGEGEFDEAVARLTEGMPPGMTLNDMLAQANTSEEEFRKTLTTELKVRKLIETQAGEPVDPTDEELQAFYEENQQQFEQPETVEASHILIGIEAGATDEEKAAARAELETIREQLLADGDFAALAAEHSSCPSKAQGGNLGRFPRGRMVPAFEEAAFTQEIGTVGEVVETQFGYHLIKVIDRDEAGLTPLDEVKEQLSQYLAGQKQQEVVQAFIETLREKAEITFPGAD
jgi:peptidyl-prolyl cis-trans isomerase C